MIDAERGKVAYALIAKGGFLGIGEEWRPVPLTALSWKGGRVYTLGQGQSQLERMPKLSSDDLPSRIRQGDLKKLYQAYDHPALLAKRPAIASSFFNLKPQGSADCPPPDESAVSRWA